MPLKFCFELLGLAIKSTLDPTDTLKYAGMVAPLVDKARNTVREFVVDEEENADDDILFLRIRTRLYEILIAPGKLLLFKYNNPRMLKSDCIRGGIHDDCHSASA